VKGFIINRFRGDIALLQSGLDWLQETTGKPVLGVLPYLHDLHLEAEDAINTQQLVSDAKFKVIVPVYPRISNHTDFDPLRLHPQVDLQFIAPKAAIPAADLIILPGSKSVRADLDWLRETGWEQAIQKHLRYGGKVIGVCGGFQMLGKKIDDPEGIEGHCGQSDGLGLLDIKTTLLSTKQLRNVTGYLHLDHAAISGYEIHAGITEGNDLAKPVCQLDTGSDGAMSDDNQVLGTYVHGLFEQTAACDVLLNWAGLAQVSSPDYYATREADIERLADMIENNMDTVALRQLLNLSDNLL
jgi:adenosylcobyric acid synthase